MTEAGLNDRLLVFGEVLPGQSVSRTIQLKREKADAGESCSLQVVFKEANGQEPAPVWVTIGG